MEMGFTGSFIGLLRKQDFFVNCCGNDRFEIWGIGEEKTNGFIKFDAFRNFIHFSGDLVRYRPDKKNAIKRLILDSYESARLAHPD